ncbi:MAG TPA: hypothetical protein VGN17_14880 [Bryobacteraceae bacterium]|jgi:hypothetical protein
MDKRLLKRHKRQVERAKQHLKVSEPDVRTPEQIQAAREASGASDVVTKGLNTAKNIPAFRGRGGPTMGSASKTDAG